MNQYLRRKIWTLNRSGKFRGYLRTVSGYPVTLTDCMAGQPVSMAVDGNAVQDGTPSPDAPVEVQLCGDRTGNLFDVQNINWNDITSGINASDSIHFENGVIRFVKNTTFYNQCRMLASIRLKPNTTYTMMYDHAVINYKDGTSIAQNSPYFRIYKSSDIDSTFNNTGFNNYYAATTSTILTFTTDETTDFEILFNSPIVPQTELLFTLKSYEVHGFMLIEGTYTAETMPAYEPYGYKVPLTIECGNLYTGELLFKPAGVSIEQIPSGYRFFYENGTGDFCHARYKCHNVKPYTAYTAQINVKVNSFSEDTRFVFRAFENKNVSDYLKTLKEYMTTYSKLGIGEIKDITIKFNTKECTDIYLQTNFSWLESSKFDVEITDIKLTEDGITPQTFNIYTPQQLAKVGDTVDTVVLDFDNKTAKLVNAVGIDNLSAEYLRDILDNVCTFVCTFNKNKILQNSNVGTTNRFVCEYGYYEDVEKAFIAMRDYDPRYVLNIAKTRIGYTEEDTSDTLVQKANDWLSENETYGLYSIANPITTDITALQDWDAMPPLWSGTAEITADTVIAPNAITAKYYASKPEEVN